RLGRDHSGGHDLVQLHGRNLSPMPRLGVRGRGLPAVELRTAAGTLAPPCPVCGDPLFGWLVAAPEEGVPGPGRVLRRCETCGLGVNADPPLPGEIDTEIEAGRLVLSGLEQSAELPAELDRAVQRLRLGQELAIRFPNRASLQASLGGARWSMLDPGAQR